MEDRLATLKAQFQAKTEEKNKLEFQVCRVGTMFSVCIEAASLQMKRLCFVEDGVSQRKGSVPRLCVQSQTMARMIGS